MTIINVIAKMPFINSAREARLTHFSLGDSSQQKMTKGQLKVLFAFTVKDLDKMKEKAPAIIDATREEAGCVSQECAIQVGYFFTCCVSKGQLLLIVVLVVGVTKYKKWPFLGHLK